MKKISISLLILGILIMGAPSAQAFTLSDLQTEIQSLKQEILGMKAKLAGQVIGSTVKVYSKGMTSTEIVKFQQKLIDRKYLQPTNTTGYFGDATYNAVLSYQKSKGLSINGTLDGATQASLLSSCDPVIKSITVISPNGDEVYVQGQQVTVKWESCNIPSTDLVNILLNIPSMSWDIGLISNYTPNDGLEVVTLPTQTTVPTFVFGKLFRINISQVTNSFPYPQDYSDNLFTINQTGGQSCEAKNDLWGYDLSTDKWTKKSSMPVIGRFSAVAFSIGSRGYVGTGQDNDGVYKNDFWEWNQDNEDINALPVWTQKADFKGSARKEAVGFSIGDEGYIGTGIDVNGATSDFWHWSLLTNEWTQVAAFGGDVRQNAVGFSIGSKGYIGTGQGAGGVHKKDFYEFDPAGDPITGMGSWTQKADFGGGFRFGAVGFSIGNKGYIGTGDSEEQFFPVVTHKDFWEWDQSKDKWTQMADFGGGLRSNAVGYSTLGQGKGYIGTGTSGEQMDTSYKKDFWEFDPAGDPITGMGSWTQKADVGGDIRAGAVGFSIRDYGYIGTGVYCGELPPPPVCKVNSWTKKVNVGGLARVYATGFSIGKKGYIGTGTTTSGNLSDFWEFDPDGDPITGMGSWTQKAEFKGGPRFRAVGFSIGKKGYIGTGTTDDAFGLNTFYEWDQNTNIWTPKASVGGVGRLGAVGFSIVDANGIGKGYVGTGLSSGTTVLKDFWEYNPATDAWNQKAPFGGGVRMGAVGFSIGGKGYVGTGASGNLFATLFNDFWEYNPGTNLWTSKAPFSGVIRKEAVGFSIVNALGIERGYIGTGFGENGALRDFRRYDPTSDKWDPKANYGGGQDIEAVGFGMGGKGYIGTGFPTGNGFWEYCPD